MPNYFVKAKRKPKEKPKFSSIAKPSYEDSKAAARKLREKQKPLPKSTRKRRAGGSEWNRIYGSKQRVAWVRRQACCVSYWGDCSGPVVNAHVCDDGQKGMGRKAGSACIAPMCDGHHRQFDEHRDHFASKDCRDAMAFYAARTEREWRAIEGAE
jgi:hypothetical protein